MERMTEHATHRQLAAILAADAVEYSRLMRADEVATVTALKRAREVFARLITTHRGRLLDTAGDSVLAEFTSAVDAVKCAVAVQQELASLNADIATERRMPFRVGVNLGDVVSDGQTLFGDGVNVAARLQALAEPGGIRISGSVHDLVRNKLDLVFEFTGRQTVKNIDEPIPVYRIGHGHARPIANLARWLSTRWVASALAVVLVVGLAVVWLAWIGPSFRTGTAERMDIKQDRPSLVVLPFANLSNDPSQEYFSDGIGGDVTTDLSRLDSLRVISRHTALTYKGQNVPVGNVARDLGVRYVIDGSVQKAGDRVRINVQLTDAKDGHQMWAERFDRPASDLFAIQDEIAQRVVKVLALTLSDVERKRFAARYTTSVEAYDLFLRGQSFYTQSTKEGNAQARELFLRAIRLDPKFARAYAALALTRNEDARYGWSNDPEASMQRALDLARHAVELDNSIPQTWWVLGNLYINDRQFDLGVAAAERALALDPNSADAYVNLAFGRVYQGRPQDAIPIVLKAMKLNPRYPTQYPSILGRAHYHLKQYSEAVQILRQVMDMNPGRTRPHLYLILSYVALGKLDDARWEAEQVLVHDPSFRVDQLGQVLPISDPAELSRMKADLRRAGLT